MTQLNESPIITVERRKAVTIIIAAVIMSLAIGGGLMQVGSGFHHAVATELQLLDLQKHPLQQIMQCGF